MKLKNRPERDKHVTIKCYFCYVIPVIMVVIIAKKNLNNPTIQEIFCYILTKYKEDSISHCFKKK